MKKIWMQCSLILVLVFSIYTPVYADWGWEPTNDPTPYYHQEWGKWYEYEDVVIFMVRMEEKTYKYIFSNDGNFLSAWVTDMPIKMLKK